MSVHANRLADLRTHMQGNGIDAVLVRSTDEYLNEYVPAEKSRRVFITGFSGSMGDALITQDTAMLFVDGRYALQARQEAPHFDVRVMTLSQSIESGWLSVLDQALALKDRSLAVEFDRIPVSLFEDIQEVATSKSLSLVNSSDVFSPFWQQICPTDNHLDGNKIWPLDISLAGESTHEKFTRTQLFFEESGLDAFVIVPLDEIAWLANLRGNDFPFQSTFASRAVALPNHLIIGTTKEHIANTQSIQGISFVENVQLIEGAQKHFPNKRFRVGLDPNQTPELVRRQLSAMDAEIVSIQSPFRSMKAIKNENELLHMRESFAKADNVVHQTQHWLCKQIEAQTPVTEADVDNFVRAQFKKSGTIELSFRPICASGKNGAVIHYGTPDSKTPIKPGTLFLLDTGGLYAGGYATDLTRTFFVGPKTHKPTPEQKRLFTLTLKGSIAGMSARFPKGSVGMQLDAIVRDPIWRAGYNYEHGTGHGVGINVHEFPPRIGPGNTTPIEVGHVFSIEPGIYLPGFGGIRIENLCTVVEDPDNNNFLRVLPLTFAPFDSRLIESTLLTRHEKEFLVYFKRCFLLSQTHLPPLPPVLG